RDLGNTVIVVEHDLETMQAADWLVDFGPGAGVKGGQVVAEGPPDQVARNGSLTGADLSGRLEIDTPDQRRQSVTQAKNAKPAPIKTKASAKKAKQIAETAASYMVE